MEDYIELEQEQKEALIKTAKAAKLYGIVLLTSVVLALGLNILSIVLSGSAMFSIISSVVGMAVTVAFGLLLVFFAKHAQDYFDTNSLASVENALKNLKWFFTLRGILYLVIVGFTFLGFFIALLFGASRSF